MNKAQGGLTIVGLAPRLTIETYRGEELSQFAANFNYSLDLKIETSTLASGLAQFYIFELLFAIFEELIVSSLRRGWSDGSGEKVSLLTF